MAPAARCTSPHISVSAAAEVATIAAYTRNWLSCPELMSMIQHRTRTEPEDVGDAGKHHRGAEGGQRRAHAAALDGGAQSCARPPAA